MAARRQPGRRARGPPATICTRCTAPARSSSSTPGSQAPETPQQEFGARNCLSICAASARFVRRSRCQSNLAAACARWRIFNWRWSVGSDRVVLGTGSSRKPRVGDRSTAALGSQTHCRWHQRPQRQGGNTRLAGNQQRGCHRPGPSDAHAGGSARGLYRYQPRRDAARSERRGHFTLWRRDGAEGNRQRRRGGH